MLLFLRKVSTTGWREKLRLVFCSKVWKGRRSEAVCDAALNLEGNRNLSKRGKVGKKLSLCYCRTGQGAEAVSGWQQTLQEPYKIPRCGPNTPREKGRMFVATSCTLTCQHPTPDGNRCSECASSRLELSNNTKHPPHTGIQTRSSTLITRHNPVIQDFIQSHQIRGIVRNDKHQTKNKAKQ